MEQELVVGEDEEGIVFDVEILFSCKSRCWVCWPITESLGSAWTFYLVISYLTPRVEQLVVLGLLKNGNLEKSLKEYFPKETEAWRRIVAFVNNAACSPSLPHAY